MIRAEAKANEKGHAKAKTELGGDAQMITLEVAAILANVLKELKSMGCIKADKSLSDITRLIADVAADAVEQEG